MPKLPKLPSHVYTCTPAGGAWTVCPALDRHPRARHLSLTKDRHSHVKGPQVCSRATTTSLVAPCTWTTIKTNDDDDDNINDRSIDDIINDNDDDDNTLTSSPSHPTLTHYATHLVSASHPRCISRSSTQRNPLPPRCTVSHASV